MEPRVGFELSRRLAAESPWTEGHIAYSRMRWSSGASAQQIARELGHGISRSAVLSMMHRLGIAGLSPFAGRRGRRSKHTSLSGREAAPRPPSIDVPVRLPRTRPAWVVNAQPYVDQPGPDVDIPLPQRRSLLELGGRTCRWPVGDPCAPDFFFCGANPVRGRPYCAAHEARSHRPKKDEGTILSSDARSRPLPLEFADLVASLERR
jgi:GcrA cell cycle regulator